MHPESQESAPAETQQLRFVPDYGLITVADVGHGGIDGELISAAYNTICAGSSKAIVIKVAQDSLAVDVRTEVWRGAPQTPHDPRMTVNAVRRGGENRALGAVSSAVTRELGNGS